MRSILQIITLILTIVLLVFLFGLIAVIISSQAQAHTLTELDDWYEDWDDRWGGSGVTIEMVEEMTDMMERHPGYIPKEFRPKVVKVKKVSHASSGAGASRGMGTNVEQWRGLVSSYFTDVNLALCVMLHESGGNPNARNSSSGAAGLFQVMPMWFNHFGGNAYDPENNVRVASLVLAEQGWSAWSAYNRGKC